MTQQPSDPELHFRQALELHRAGRVAEAERAYRAALQLRPRHPGALLYLGVAHYDRREFDEAIRLISRAIEVSPREPSAYNHMGLALLARRELDEAIGQFETALRLKPGHHDALCNLGNALKRSKRFEAAEARFREALVTSPRSVVALHNLGLLLFERQRFEEAEQLFLQVLGLAPDFHKSHYFLGQAAENLGRFPEAAARYEAVLRQVPDHAPAMSALLALRDHEPDESVIAAAETMVGREDVPDPESYTLCFGLAKRFEKRGDYDTAFRYLELANRRRRRKRGYDPKRVEDVVERYVAVFTRDFIQRHSVHGSDSDRPVFVVGMPRTGTTLTEQILAAHPQVFGAGELPDLPAVTNLLAATIAQEAGGAEPGYPACLSYVRPPHLRPAIDLYLGALTRRDSSAARVVDKNPFNFINVGLMAVLFPRARIIHCRRDPMDVAVSCYTELFELKQDFTTDFESFAHYYGQYERLMRHWREVVPAPFLDVAYETLVTDTEPAVRSMLDHCGLPWDDACLAFQQTQRPVLTPSKWQVRQPIYASSVSRWRRYERHLGPLRRALEERGIAVDQ
jgi:tetratricopeptide (TPR) repeat protein